jgi:hypothetical protein
VALAAYTGWETLTFLQYIDASTGRTLTCVPGETYDILPQVPDDGLFAPVEMINDDTASPEGEEDSPEETGENV